MLHEDVRHSQRRGLVVVRPSPVHGELRERRERRRDERLRPTPPRRGDRYAHVRPGGRRDQAACRGVPVHVVALVVRGDVRLEPVRRDRVRLARNDRGSAHTGTGQGDDHRVGRVRRRHRALEVPLIVRAPRGRMCERASRTVLRPRQGACVRVLDQVGAHLRAGLVRRPPRTAFQSTAFQSRSQAAG